MSNTLMKKVTKQDIGAAKLEAERLYLGRLDGHGEDFTATPVNGRLPRRHFRGALEEFAVLTADTMLKLVVDKLQEGYGLSGVPTQVVGQAYTVYLVKPESVRAEELKEEYKEVEAKLQAAVAAENEAIIQNTYEQRLATERRKREEAAKAAEQAEKESLMAEVRAALMGSK
ncbi:hypothetical protein PS627_01199 [Pseudomonas fluorescens]|uniref:hypothetical protein n=1 Tax=Pseudomonas fluorescens TaxID=294 RepID=UPI00125669A3|nr:hypothetical protein [Pseudomonas fluorescens]CAG8865287.1 hypothetical protein PS627_01199 [Pseudomonas fluorescens]